MFLEYGNMSLTGKQKHFLRSLAHHRKPNVAVGAGGLSDSVLQEINIALQHHELLKIKLPTADRIERKQLVQQICATSQADMVQLIGRICLIYRSQVDPVIRLPE